jgi:RNA-directed DNA polymerase
VISPLLANIYLNKLDTAWTELKLNSRYKYNSAACQICRRHHNLHRQTGTTLGISWDFSRSFFLSSNLGLKLSQGKARIVTADEGFDFLGFRFLRRFEFRMGKEVTRFFPSKSAVRKFRDKVRDLTRRTITHTKDESQLAKELNLLIIGWSNYFNHSNASETYGDLQHYVEWKFRQFMRFKHQIRRLAAKYDSFNQPFRFGLKRLAGRISHVTWEPHALR